MAEVEAYRYNGEPFEFPVEVYMTEEAAKEILATLKLIPKNKRQSNVIQLIKELKRVTK